SAGRMPPISGARKSAGSSGSSQGSGRRVAGRPGGRGAGDRRFGAPGGGVGGRLRWVAMTRVRSGGPGEDEGRSSGEPQGESLLSRAAAAAAPRRILPER